METQGQEMPMLLRLLNDHGRGRIGLQPFHGENTVRGLLAGTSTFNGLAVSLGHDD